MCVDVIGSGNVLKVGCLNTRGYIVEYVICQSPCTSGYSPISCQKNQSSKLT